LDIAFIDVTSSVKFVFNHGAKGHGLAVDEQMLRDTKKEIDAALEAKMNEGKKPSKDKNAPVTEVKLDENDISDAFCQSLPLETVRRCVSATLLLDRRCVRRGYVLDVWERDGLVNAPGGDGLYRLLRLCSSASSSAAAREHFGGDDTDKEQGAAAQSVAASPTAEIVIELQVGRSVGRHIYCNTVYAFVHAVSV
jgi:hypothetical protein